MLVSIVQARFSELSAASQGARNLECGNGGEMLIS